MEMRVCLEKEESKALSEKATSSEKSDELHGLLDTKGEDREESDILQGVPDAYTTSDESDEDCSLMHNYDNLQNYLRTDVAKFLRKVLKKSYKDIESVRKSKIYETLENESKEEITKYDKFTLNLPVLCDILLKGKSQAENGNYQLYDDIELIKNIWTTKIIENREKILSPDDSKKIEKDLKKVRDRMAKCFGKTFLKRKVQPGQAEFCEGGQRFVQIGDWNTMHLYGKPNSELNIFTFGDNNKVIPHIHNDRKTEQLEQSFQYKATNLRTVLHVSLTEEENNRITESLQKLDVDLLNSNPKLKENNIHIISICSLSDQISDHKTKRHHSVKTERRHSVTFQSPFSRLNGMYISVTIQ